MQLDPDPILILIGLWGQSKNLRAHRFPSCPMALCVHSPPMEGKRSALLESLDFSTDRYSSSGKDPLHYKRQTGGLPSDLEAAH